MVSLVNFKETLIEDLKDPHYARTYLSVALETYEKDKDRVSFLTALRDVAEAKGGMTQLSKKTKLNRENLYKVLSSKGNPRLSTIGILLHGLGFRLDIQPIEQIA